VASSDGWPRNRLLPNFDRAPARNLPTLRAASRTDGKVGLAACGGNCRLWPARVGTFLALVDCTRVEGGRACSSQLCEHHLGNHPVLSSACVLV
jgi:hypothetical protein